MSLATNVRTHWKAWVAGGVAAVALLAVGVPYAYVTFFTSAQPAALSVEAGRAAPTGTVDGAFAVAAESQAGYRVHEILAGQSVEAVGRTTGVTGTATVSGTTVSAGTITVDLTGVTSDEERRDAQFTGRIMNTAEFPTATFTLTAPVELGAGFTSGEQVTATATGDLTLRGVTRSVTFPVTAARDGSAIDVSGSVPVTFADFGITPPSIGDFVKVDPQGAIEFLVDLAPAS